ncbi:sodium-dependent transporter [Bacteroides fragilis]|nr:sodium-dependent transporter [Bacteroides fragilis]MCS2971511.1 sodium-dependent transporter [Bacteroides fragilis]MCS2989234.1 sodium-dependent transporter [Bacteroides fragilis]MCS3274381.1 sodium-dependent transporter [Bacteroides fragilis]UVP66511.1 sodium-dependent transporter [Bacteroides fragilis]
MTYTFYDKKERGNFGSKLGVILASAGSAVGLGNIWRFPYETGNHGGAAFILIYLGCILLLGLPIMIAEFLIGRHSQANTARAYQILAPGTQWRWVGRMGVLAGFLILGYYSVVAGWTLEYIFEAVSNSFAGKTPAEFISSFQSFSSNPWRPALWLTLFLLATHFIIVKGVEKGIEKSSKIMMPTLFIIILILVGCSVTLPGAGKGIEFLLKPDFSKVDGNVFLGAMGQAFFSLSLGMGCLCTYASYFSKNTNLTRTAFSVGIIDTFVAVLAGFIIFPAAFSVGIQPDAGPSLIFITLPNVFQQAFSGIPILAYIFSVMFYVLLALAALTSTISLHEVVTAYLHEEFNFTRGKAARLVTTGCILLGILCSLSLGVTKEFTIFGLGMFDLFDFVTAKLMLPLGGLLISIFTGWYLDKKLVWSEITNNGTLKVPTYKLIIFILKYVAPIAISVIFINELGLLK